MAEYIYNNDENDRANYSISISKNKYEKKLQNLLTLIS